MTAKPCYSHFLIELQQGDVRLALVLFAAPSLIPAPWNVRHYSPYTSLFTEIWVSLIGQVILCDLSGRQACLWKFRSNTLLLEYYESETYLCYNFVSFGIPSRFSQPTEGTPAFRAPMTSFLIDFLIPEPPSEVLWELQS